MTALAALLTDFNGRCTICHFHRSGNAGHATIHCPSDTIGPTSVYRNSFRSAIILPPGLACYLCGVPFAPPTNHALPQPSPATIDPTLCPNPDLLKPLAWLIFDTAAVKGLVFAEVGLPLTTTLAAYCQWLAQTRVGGLLNLYEIIVAYRTLRRRRLV
jgi:hypothetical protein